MGERAGDDGLVVAPGKDVPKIEQRVGGEVHVGLGIPLLGAHFAVKGVRTHGGIDGNAEVDDAHLGLGTPSLGRWRGWRRWAPTLVVIAGIQTTQDGTGLGFEEFGGSMIEAECIGLARGEEAWA